MLLYERVPIASALVLALSMRFSAGASQAEQAHERAETKQGVRLSIDDLLHDLACVRPDALCLRN